MSRSRRLKLVLGMIALQAFAMLLVFGVTYVASQDMLYRFSESFAARVSSNATAYTEGFLEPANETVQITHRLVEREIFASDSPATLQRYFLELLSVRETLDGIYLGQENGDFLFATRGAPGDPGAFRLKRITNAPERLVTNDWYSAELRQVGREQDPSDAYDPRNRPWYTEAKAEDAVIWTKPYVFFTSQEPGITAAVPVHDLLGAQVSGVVGVDIKITELSAFLETLDISPRGEAAIVSQDGEIIAHSRPGQVGGEALNRVVDGSDPILAEAARQIPGGLSTLYPGEIRLARFDAEGEAWLGAVLRLELERTPWTVVTYLPESDILAPLYRVRHIALVISLVALVMTAALGLLIGRRVMS